MISWRFGLFGLIEKVNWFSAQKLICKVLTYLLHVNSFGLSPNFRPNGLAQSFRSVLWTESEQKIDFTFWFNFRSVRISDWAKRLSERLIQKVKWPIIIEIQNGCQFWVSSIPKFNGFFPCLLSIIISVSWKWLENFCCNVMHGQNVNQTDKQRETTTFPHGDNKHYGNWTDVCVYWSTW